MPGPTDTTLKAQSPYEGFVQLGSCVYLREPKDTSDTVPPSYSGDVPSTIIISTWMAAPASHIAKYIAGYITLFQDSRILLITCSQLDMFAHVHTTRSSQQRSLATAVSALVADPYKRFHVHAFSVGGTLQLCNLSIAFTTVTGRILPIRALILDSTPVSATDFRSADTMLYSLPHYVQWLRVLGASHVILWSWRLNAMLLMKRDVFTNMGKELNDPNVIPKEAPRSYIYSEEDRIVCWEDVEAHALRAEKRGYRVEREKFKGSRHVAHMMADKARYWRIIARQWNAPIKASL